MPAIRIFRRLRDLLDVTFGTPADGDVVTYDTATGKFIMSAPSGGGGGTDLQDVLAFLASVGFTIDETSQNIVHEVTDPDLDFVYKIVAPADFGSNFVNDAALWKALVGAQRVFMIDCYGELFLKTPTGQGTSALLRLESADNPTELVSLSANAGLEIQGSTPGIILVDNTTGFAIVQFGQGDFGSGPEDGIAFFEGENSAGIAPKQSAASISDLWTALRKYGLLKEDSVAPTVYAAGGTDVTVADGGTGSSTAAGARTNLGLVIGTDVEAHDPDLTTIAGLTPTNDDIMQRKAGAWANRTIAQLKSDLSLSGTNTGDQTTVSGNAGTATALQTGRAIDGQNFDGTAAITVIAPGTHAATGKTTPVDADEMPLVDSAASNVLKKLTWANLKATLKTYFDTLYPSGSGTSSGTNTGDQTISDATISTTDITTNNATSSKHGFLPKLDGSATKVLLADGTYGLAPLYATNVQTASYTLVLGDAGKIVEMNVGSANNLTVPPNSSVAFPVGTVISVHQYGAGQTTVLAGSGVTIDSASSKVKLTGQFSSAAIRKRATDEWVLAGDLSA